MRAGALRQPPPLAEAARTGWIRLEPAVPAREPAPHKGRRRLTARVFLRRAGVGNALLAHPSPILCSRPAASGVWGLRVGGFPQPSPRPGGSGRGAEFGRVERGWMRPPPPTHLARFRFSPVETRVGKPPAPLFLKSCRLARQSSSPSAAPRNEVFLRNPVIRCLVSFPCSWETPGGALEAKLKLQKGKALGLEKSLCFPCNSSLKHLGAQPEIMNTDPKNTNCRKANP